MTRPPDKATGQGAARPYLNTAQAAHYLRIGERKLQKLRVSGKGPRCRHHGRLIFYHPDDLELWSQATADTGEQP
jgi:hypothetical protein